MDATLYDKLTPTQKRVLTVLADGKKHPRQELFDALGDPELCLSNLSMHLSAIRKVLKITSEDIVVSQESNGDGRHTFYTWVRILQRDIR